MGIIENAKDIADIIKKAGDIELYRKIVELEGEIIDLTREKRSLEEIISEKDKEIQRIKDALELKPKLIKQYDAYYQINDKGEATGEPYCMHCWEVNHKAIYLFSSGPNNRCHSCQTGYVELRTRTITP